MKLNANQETCLLEIAHIIEKAGHCSVMAVDNRSGTALERRGLVCWCMERYGRDGRFWREVWRLTSAGEEKLAELRG